VKSENESPNREKAPLSHTGNKHESEKENKELYDEQHQVSTAKALEGQTVEDTALKAINDHGTQVISIAASENFTDPESQTMGGPITRSQENQSTNTAEIEEISAKELAGEDEGKAWWSSSNHQVTVDVDQIVGYRLAALEQRRIKVDQRYHLVISWNALAATQDGPFYYSVACLDTTSDPEIDCDGDLKDFQCRVWQVWHRLCSTAALDAVVWVGAGPSETSHLFRALQAFDPESVSDTTVWAGPVTVTSSPFDTLGGIYSVSSE
jgi:hypothetical protein